MRILYVEDNEVNRALVERVVRARKYSVVFHDEGEDALKTLEADPSIDLILLDIELAGSISGLDVIRTLRGRGDKRPVVAVTAYAMMGDRERILEAGCDQYLPKPLVITDLLTLLDHYQENLTAKAAGLAAPAAPILSTTPAAAPAQPVAAPVAAAAPAEPVAAPAASAVSAAPAASAVSAAPAAPVPTPPAAPAPIPTPAATAAEPPAPVAAASTDSPAPAVSAAPASETAAPSSASPAPAVVSSAAEVSQPGKES